MMNGIELFRPPLRKEELVFVDDWQSQLYNLPSDEETSQSAQPLQEEIQKQKESQERQVAREPAGKAAQEAKEGSLWALASDDERLAAEALIQLSRYTQDRRETQELRSETQSTHTLENEQDTLSDCDTLIMEDEQEGLSHAQKVARAALGVGNFGGIVMDL